MARLTVLVLAALCALAAQQRAWAADKAPETSAPKNRVVARVDTPRGTSVTLENGLRYMDLKPGTGPEVTSASTVKIHYRGTLVASGRQFDNSRQRIIPSPLKFTIGAGAVVSGMEQGFDGMRNGGTRLLEVPSALGYGSKGRSPGVPPDSDLLFEVELVEVK